MCTGGGRSWGVLILDKRKRRESFHVSELREVDEAALYRKKERINH